MHTDTSPEAARIQAEVWRRMTPARRLEIAFELSAFVRELARQRIARRHPDWGEAELRDALIWELYGIRVPSR